MTTSSKLLTLAATIGAVASVLSMTAAFADQSSPADTQPLVTMSSTGAINLGAFGTVDPTGEALASFFGTSSSALASELASGRSLAQLAIDHGIAVDDLRAFLRAEVLGQVLGASDAGLISEPDAWQSISEQFAALDTIVGEAEAPQVGSAPIDAPVDLSNIPLESPVVAD